MSGAPSWIQEVRVRLGSPPPKRMAASDSRHAAVLVPLYIEAGELWTLLTRRSESLAQHRGQVAFPGGGRETGEDFWGAALRESEEEIGLPPRRVLRLGELDEVGTPSGFRIVPCVGAIPFPFEAEPNPDEIDEVFAVPIPALAHPNLVEEREVLLNGRRRMLRLYHVGRHVVWGVTARILQNLLERLGLGDERWHGEGLE
ncbi:MAG TPA: CoA pyrophosphatase [Thermoanaerobaculia bacterium]|nr:CoA pyrophosphatase [Thermoanaerobaculia bacterium]